MQGRTRVDAVIHCAMGLQQRGHYDALARRCLGAFTSGRFLLAEGYHGDENFDSEEETFVARRSTALVSSASEQVQVLPTIQKLRAICNSIPDADVAPDVSIPLINRSAKLLLLHHFFAALRVQAPAEKVVVVSNFTATLDQVQGLAAARQYVTLRLDGKVANPSSPPNPNQGSKVPWCILPLP